MGIWSNKLRLIYYGTPLGWKITPKWAWDAYKKFRNPIQSASPNPSHTAIAQIQQLLTSNNARCTVITQNVDNLHQKAGAVDVIELHGSVFRHKCIRHHHPMSIPEDSFITSSSIYPTCSQCKSHSRPDCVLFNEGLPEDAFRLAGTAVAKCDLMLVVGTSGVVLPRRRTV